MVNLLDHHEKGFKEGKITAARLVEFLATSLQGNYRQKLSLKALEEKVASARQGDITTEITNAESELRAGQLLFEQTRKFSAINKNSRGLFYDPNDQDEYGNHLVQYIRDSEGHVDDDDSSILLPSPLSSL